MINDRTSKVSVTRCMSYNTVDVESSVRKVIDDLGGIEKFVYNGETILIKPNMLHPRDPKDAVTTHPEIVRAVIRLVREVGAIPIVGDSPSGRSNEKILRRLAEKTGIGKVCEEENVEFVFFIESQSVPFPEGIIIKSFDITTCLSNVDGVISIAKMKTHTFTGLTGAVKNLFGLIPGLKKNGYHSQMPSLEMFSEFLVDLAEYVRPRLTIVDGIIGMEGDGPMTGTVRNFNRIIASTNPHVLDAVITDMIGAKPNRIMTVDIARKRGLIPENIEIIGDIYATARIDKFKMPDDPKILNNMLNLLGVRLDDRKPVFLGSRCIFCGLCIDACPGNALKKGNKVPIVDYELCIRCYCCQEICDHNAIILKRLFIISLGRAILSNIRRRF